MEEFELFLVQCWLIWNQRNTVVRGGKLQDPTQLNIRARDYLEEFKEAKNQLAIPAHAMPSQSWRPPYGSVYKLNFDVAVFTQIGASGCGVVVRNEMGLEHLQRFGYPALLAIIWRMRCIMDAPTDSANMDFFFFWLMNSSPSSLMGYCSFFKYIFSIIIMMCCIKKCWKMCSC